MEIAEIFEDVLNRKVTIQQVPINQCENTLLQAGFSKDGGKNLMLMTKAVIEGKTKNETSNPVCFSIDFMKYLKSIL